jgi:hypothetical protein
MTMQRIRDIYRVPAKRGGRVCYRNYGHPIEGTITGSDQTRMWIRVRLDGFAMPMLFHPTWELEYLDGTEQQGTDQ